MSLADYEALIQLAHADGRRLRMSELADRMILTRSGISRLVDRLEAVAMSSEWRARPMRGERTRC
jgi:DNA-binding MarR family transcriptional regulator